MLTFQEEHIKAEKQQDYKGSVTARIEAKRQETLRAQRKVQGGLWLGVLCQVEGIQKLRTALLQGRKQRKVLARQEVAARTIQQNFRMMAWYLRYRRKRFERAADVITRNVRIWYTRKKFRETMQVRVRVRVRKKFRETMQVDETCLRHV